MNRRLRGLIYTVPGLVLGAAGAASCGGTVVSEGDPPPLYVPCGLTCPVDGVAQGNPGISGDPKVDGFFRSVVHLRSTAGVVSAGIRAELDAIARSVGARGGDDADLKARLREKLASRRLPVYGSRTSRRAAA